MSRLNKILLFVFVLQTGLIFLMAGSGGALSVNNRNEALLGLTLADILEFKISDSSKTISLAKNNDVWVLPETDNFPVEKSKIEDVFGEVLKIKAGFPVGTTMASTKQFKTSDNEFEKQLRIKKNDGQEILLYLGKSPAFRQVYIRKQGSEQTYAVNFESYRLATDNNSWFSRDLLKIEKSEIDYLKVKNIEILKVDNKFTLPDIKENEEVKTEGIDDLLGRVSGVLYSDMPVKEKPADFDSLPLALDYKLKVKGADRDLVFRGPLKKKEESEPNAYYAKSSASPYYFKVAESAVTGFDEIGRGLLVAEKVAASAG